jgi:hypothetical protein
MMADPYGFARVQGPPPAPGLNYSAAWGQGGNFSVYGNPNPGAYGAGFNLSGRGGSPNAGPQGGGANGRDPVWSDVRDFQFGAYSSESQTVLNAGGTLAFTYEDQHALAGRALLGGAFGGLSDDAFHFSGDLFAATQTELFGDHWVKAGILYDQQDQFSKVGPEIGLLLFARSPRPLSVDFVYGIGQGDPYFNNAGTTLTAAANDDVQLRVGTFLGPYIQLGMTGTYYSWDDERFQDVGGFGGFATLNLDYFQMTFDLTHDDLGTRGFANIALTTGAWSTRNRERNRKDAPVVHPRDWLTRPVIRDVSLRMQTASTTAAERAAASAAGSSTAAPAGGVGNLSGVLVQRDQIGSLQFFPSPTFSVNLFAQASSQGATNVFTDPTQIRLVNNSPATIANVAQIFSITAAAPQNIPPNQASPLLQPGLGVFILVNQNAQPNQVITLEFPIFADGQSGVYQATFLVSQTNSPPPVQAVRVR